MKALAWICAPIMWLGSIGIYVGGLTLHVVTIIIASHEGLFQAVATFVLPGLAEIYWFAAIWRTRGEFWNPYTQWCCAYVALFVLVLGLAAIYNRYEESQSGL